MEHKVLLREDRTVHIRCPLCMSVRDVPYDKLPHRHKLTVKCKCGYAFNVKIELRKSYRKDVNFEGTFLFMYQDLRWGKMLSESIETKIKPINCRITNISLGGVCITVKKNIVINENDRILIRFNLDNSASTKVEKTAIVKKIKEGTISCEFDEPTHNDKDLKFYFL